MTDFDVFNGDADGICALVQLRNAEPRDSRLITGVKRDIALLDSLAFSAGDRVTVLDVSLDKNRVGLTSALDAGAKVFYCDHHFAGDIPQHPNLTASINTASDVCTSLLINDYLRGQCAEWAIVGAFGDNLNVSGQRLAEALRLDTELVPTLAKLGVLINYNAYGASIDDLHITPAALYERLVAYRSPALFLENDHETFELLESGYDADMAKAANAETLNTCDHAAVILLPDAPWSRRVSGVLGNALANQHPERAHAVMTERDNQSYLVSVRAPLSNKTGADAICRQFPTGGGRKAAAGINELPADQLQQFIETLERFYAPA